MYTSLFPMTVVFTPAFPCWWLALASVASPCLPMAMGKRAAVIQTLKKTIKRRIHWSCGYCWKSRAFPYTEASICGVVATRYCFVWRPKCIELHLVSNFIIHASHPTEASFPALYEYLSPIMNTCLYNAMPTPRHFWIWLYMHRLRLHNTELFNNVLSSGLGYKASKPNVIVYICQLFYCSL